ncbi:MAG: hypothetical protein IKK05_06525 [Alistipes sp.]|nr:hypothetical protein [Alistipes sp.]
MKTSKAPKMTPYHNKEPNFLSEGVSCEAGRRLKKRSLLKVNEHFSDKPDAADDPLSQEITYL